VSKFLRGFIAATAAVFFSFWTLVDIKGLGNLDLFLHGVSLALAVYFFVRLVRLTREAGPARWLGGSKRQDLDVDALRAQMLQVLHLHDEPIRRYFQYVLFQLPAYLVRVDERVTLAARGSEVKNTIWFQLDRPTLLNPPAPPEQHQEASPPSQQPHTTGSTADPAKSLGHDPLMGDHEDHHEPYKPDYILLPVFRCKKGERIDELTVTDNTIGRHAPRLSREEAAALTSLALRTLVRYEAAQLSLRPTIDADLLDQFLVDICNGTPIDICARLNEIMGTANAQLVELVHLCDYLSQNYLIIAELAMPDFNQIIVEVGHFAFEIAPILDSTPKMRKRFGLSPLTAELPMTYAFQAQFYHFQMSAPRDQYVYDHRLELLNTNYLVEQSDLEIYDHPHVRVYHQDGRTNAHCYIWRRPHARRIAQLTPPDLKSVIEFREIPPGALGAAAIVATAVAALIVFFTVTRIAISGPGDASASTNLFNSDIPAVLLALPAFAALLLGHWADPARLPRASLSAYIGFLFTMFLSFSAAVLFILDANRHLSTQVLAHIWSNNGRGGWNLTGDWIWFALSGLASAHAIHLIGRLHGELKYYVSLPKEIAVSKPLGDIAS
jgi:hypothetical protein